MNLDNIQPDGWYGLFIDKANISKEWWFSGGSGIWDFFFGRDDCEGNLSGKDLSDFYARAEKISGWDEVLCHEESFAIFKPEVVDYDYDPDDMSPILRRNNDGPTIRFSGKIIAHCQESDDPTADNYSGQPGIWTEYNLYQTNKEHFVAERIRHTCNKWEMTKYDALYCDEAHEVYRFYGSDENRFVKQIYLQAMKELEYDQTLLRINTNPGAWNLYYRDQNDQFIYTGTEYPDLTEILAEVIEMFQDRLDELFNEYAFFDDNLPGTMIINHPLADSEKINKFVKDFSDAVRTKLHIAKEWMAATYKDDEEKGQ
jgi:hypothetical protein